LEYLTAESMQISQLVLIFVVDWIFFFIFHFNIFS